MPAFVLAGLFGRLFRKPQPFSGEERGVALVEIAGDIAQGVVEPCRSLLEPGMRIAEREFLFRHGIGS